MDFKKDYYLVLGVPRKATAEQIKKAYRSLAKKFHPDLHPGNTAFEEKIKAVNEAYEVLGNGDNRFVYDHYQETAPVAEPKPEPAKPQAPPKNQRSYTKKVVITKEEKIYVKGTIYIKYRGKQNDEETLDVLKEVVYDLRITEVRVVINGKDIYREALTPQAYHEAIATGEKSLRIVQPIKSTVISASGDSHYELEIFDLAISNLVFDNVTVDDGDSYGSLRGGFYGYIKHTTTVERETTVTECYGETGQKEQKTENGIKYHRKEYYQNDCTRYWGNWIPDYVPPPPRRAAAVQSTGCLPSIFSILQWGYAVIFLIYFLAKLYFLIPFLVIAGLFWLIAARHWAWLFRGIGLLLLGLFVFSVIGAFDHQPLVVPVIKDQPRELRPRKTSVKNDSLISYYRNWKDYDGNSYEGQYAIRKSAFINAKNYKNGLNAGYDEMLYDLSENDKGKLDGLYQLLDGVKLKNKLQPQKFAEVIVALVQDIPYAVVLPEACDASLYADQFISKYLASANAQCDGDEKFGINTPVEFLATLKGDCDTRALLLYTIFSHYGYDVALLSSEHYSHSMIGINLPFDGIAYAYREKNTSCGKPPHFSNRVSSRMRSLISVTGGYP
jgi:curved DNA-binding protein CbpA